MFRRLVRLGCFAACWRQANVTPIPKGPPSSVANYRPISIMYCLRCSSTWCRFASDDLWNEVVCCQPPSLLIGKVWVSVMHFCVCRIHCKVHWRVGRRIGSYRLISGLSLICRFNHQGILYTLCSVGIGVSVFSILPQFLSNRSQHVMADGCTSKLANVVSGLPQGSVLDPLLFLLYTSEHFSILENKLIGCANDSTLIAVVPSPVVGVTVAEFLSRDLVKVSEWCDLWE